MRSNQPVVSSPAPDGATAKAARLLAPFRDRVLSPAAAVHSQPQAICPRRISLNGLFAKSL
jgi:hypothetical protein